MATSYALNVETEKVNGGSTPSLRIRASVPNWQTALAANEMSGGSIPPGGFGFGIPTEDS